MANNNFSFVDDLTSARDLWHIKVRVIKRWRQSYRLDFIFIDEKGKKIQACVRDDLIPEFEHKLREDGVYVLRKVGVGLQQDKYRVIVRDLKINFYRCTDVVPVSVFQGSLYGFNFVPFEDINQNRANNVLTVDVIGRLSWCGSLDIFQTKQKESKRVNFDLEDLSGNVLKCTLWDNFAMEFNKFISTYNSNEMIITIIQHAKVKQWIGRPTIQNDMYGTRVFMNEDLTEANDLRRRFIAKDGASSSQSQLTSETVYPLRQEFLKDTKRIHIDRIRDAPMFSEWIVLATIKSLEPEHGWFYIACRKCNRKVGSKAEYLKKVGEIDEEFEKAPEDSLWCFLCKQMAKSVIPRFRVQFRVQDETGSISFSMFDKDVSRIVGLSATDIRERQLKSDQMEHFPHELDALLNKTYAFKISVSRYNIESEHYVYTVGKFTDDPTIISELENGHADDQVIHETVEESSVRLSDSSQYGVDSKDALSVTGDSLAVENGKDSATSPSQKRTIDVVSNTHDQASTSKKMKKKLLA